MPKKAFISKNLNQGVKPFIAISRKGERVIASADSRSELVKKLKKRKSAEYFVLERPKVREVTVQTVSAATLKVWKNNREAQKNLKKQYLKIL